MATIVIFSLIIIYSIFVIRRKCKNIKAGKYCNCGCDSCSSECRKSK